MNRRQIMGCLSVVLGVVLIILAVHSMNEFARTKGLSSDVKHFFTNNPLWNPLLKLFGGKPQIKVPDHDTKALITQVIGIVLFVAGCIMALVPRKRKKRK